MWIWLLLFWIPVSKTILLFLLLMSILTPTLLRKHYIKLLILLWLKQNYLPSDMGLVKLSKFLTFYVLLLSLILFIWLKKHLTSLFIPINYNQSLSLKILDHTSTNTLTIPSNSRIVQVMKSGYFIYWLIKIQKNLISLSYILAKHHGISTRKKSAKIS